MYDEEDDIEKNPDLFKHFFDFENKMRTMIIEIISPF